MARYARGIMLVMCMLLSSLPRATIAETEEDIMILQQVHDNLLKIRQKITDQSGTVIS